VFVKVCNYINVFNHHISSDAAFTSFGSQDHYGVQLVSRNNKWGCDYAEGPATARNLVQLELQVISTNFDRAAVILEQYNRFSN
jgi:hypothetical protein